MAEIKLIGKGFEFVRLLKSFEKAKRDLPLKLANDAKNHFLLGFRKGGYQTNKSRTGWKKRRFEDAGRAILVSPGGGKLRSDIKVKQASFSRIVIGTGSMTNDYADIHNKGGTINVTAKQRGYFISQYKKEIESGNKDKAEMWRGMIGASKIEIPQREYIGDSTELNRKLAKRIVSELNKFMRGR